MVRLLFTEVLTSLQMTNHVDDKAPNFSLVTTCEQRHC